MSFPSDTVTVRDIRDRDNAVFEGEHHGMGDRLDALTALDALGTEMDLAEYAFERERGFKGLLYGELGRDDLVGELLKAYERMGIGEGEQSRMQLIRQIEADAAAQARGVLGQKK